MQPSLKFIETPYPSSHLGNLLAQFRAKGYVVLPNVFKRESVDKFRQEVESAIVKTQDGHFELPDDRPELVYPLKAPRIRDPLSLALSPSQMAPKISVFETAWLISESGKNLGGWHKDRQHEGMPSREYHYPLAVHLGIYYRDIESIEEDTNYWLFSIDLAEGNGGDYSVINIFQVDMMSHEHFKLVTSPGSFIDFFCLRQVARFRSNEHTIEDFAKILYTLSLCLLLWLIISHQFS